MKLCRLAFTLLPVLAVGAFVNAWQIISEASAAAPGAEGGYGFAPVLALGAFVLAVLAFRSVKKDDELVRSVDRLR